jgi:hypothetical protein
MLSFLALCSPPPHSREGVCGRTIDFPLSRVLSPQLWYVTRVIDAECDNSSLL